MRWLPSDRGPLPQLSIRAAVLLALLSGLLLPALARFAFASGSVGLLPMLIAQCLCSAAAVAGVLLLRLVRPLALMTREAAAAASTVAEGGIAEPKAGGDELAPLGRQLEALRERTRGLLDEAERKGELMRRMAMVDPLTGLPNRNLFRELFQHEVATARRSGRQMAMLFIDLDRFKTINDAMGHEVGDQLLIGTSQRLLQALRASDLVCRHSGDEFLVLLHHADRWETVAAAAERLLEAIEAPLPLTARHLPGETLAPGDEPGPGGVDNGSGEPISQLEVSACVGIAMYPRDGDTFDQLVRHADLAMHQSKQQGRARYSFFHAELDKRLVARLGLERDLARGIAQGELMLHYQPVTDASGGALHGCEALVRWNHPTRGLLLPAAFIGIAEESGLVRELGVWTLATACAQIAQWRSEGLEVGRVSVNISALQFRDQQLVRLIENNLERHQVRAAQLEIELTESTLMIDDDATQRVVAALRALGVALVVDDFGTGYSSLSYLKRLRPDKLKIDRSFVQDLPHDADDCALTAAILSMAQALDIVVVAEGVVTEAQRDLLTELGCDLLQGYLTGRPMPAAEFALRLRAELQRAGAPVLAES